MQLMMDYIVPDIGLPEYCVECGASTNKMVGFFVSSAANTVMKAYTQLINDENTKRKNDQRKKMTAQSRKRQLPNEPPNRKEQIIFGSNQPSTSAKKVRFTDEQNNAQDDEVEILTQNMSQSSLIESNIGSQQSQDYGSDPDYIE